MPAPGARRRRRRGCRARKTSAGGAQTAGGAMKRKLLIIDDDDAVLEYLRIKLGARYELVLSTDCAHVMELARKERPDLILCDIDMPGMDGGYASAARFADDTTRDVPMSLPPVLRTDP